MGGRSSRHPDKQTDRHNKANTAVRNCLAELRNYCACYTHMLSRRGLLYELPEPHFGTMRLGQEPHIKKIAFHSFI